MDCYGCDQYVKPYHVHAAIYKLEAQFNFAQDRFPIHHTQWSVRHAEIKHFLHNSHAH